MSNRIALTLSALVLSTPSLAQQVVLSGTVSATDGAPLRGVSVHVVDTQLRAVTDAQGKYSLSVPPNSVVAFSLAGRRPTQQQVGAQSTVDVTMEPDRFWQRAVFPGTLVRVRTADKTYEGSFVQLFGERFIVQSAAATDSIPLREVGVLWQREPAIEPAARIGLLVGALAAGIVTYQETRGRVCLLNSMCGPSARAMYVAFSSFLGAAGGALGGAAVGRSFAVWARVHP